MALIRCAACSEVVSSLVRTCPSCRLPMRLTHVPAAGTSTTMPERTVTPRRVLPSAGRASHFPTRT